VAQGVVDAYPRRYQPLEVTMRLARVKKLLGIEVPTDVVLRILSALCFEPRLRDGSVVCTVPTWRSDVDREVDLIEEVARVYGYDKVPTHKRIHIEARAADPRQKMTQTVGTFLAGCGFYETINVDFVDQPVAEVFSAGGALGHMGVRDVTRKAGNLLRRTLLGSLLGVLKTNVNAKNLPCRIYEIADTFVPTGVKDGLPQERAKLGLVVDSEFRVLRGAVEGLVKNINHAATVEFVPTELPWAQAGAQVRVNGRVMGEAGVFSDAVRERFDLKDLTPAGAELDFEELMELGSGSVKIKPIPRFPAIERDLSIVAAEQVLWTDMIRAVQEVAPAELEETRFVDIYRGKGIAPGTKSVTLSLRFRDEDGTLMHETVDKYQAAILESLKRAVGAELRTL
jgi:phenylalanyl-tRNA synthetase beta chain